MYSILHKPLRSFLPADISWPIFLVITLQFFQSALLNAGFVFLLNFFLIFHCARINFKIYLFDRYHYYLWFLLFEIWAIGSIYWSSMPKVTMHAVAIELAYFVSIVLSIIYTIHYKKNFIKTLVLSAGFILFLVYSYILISPGGSFIGGSLVAFYQLKNHLGMTLAVAMLILLFSDITLKYKLIWIGIGSAALILSQSKTSLSGFILTLTIISMVYVIIKKLDKSDTFFYAIASSFFKLLKYTAFALVIGIFIYRLEIVDFMIHNLTDEMFTGRGKLWHSVLILVKSNLEQGLGVAVMWGASRASEIAQSPIYMQEWVQGLTSADGGYVDLIGALGFIGLSLLFFSFIQTYNNLFASRGQKGFYLFLGLITFIFIHNFTESHIYRFRDILWSLYTYVYFYIAFTRSNTANKAATKAHT